MSDASVRAAALLTSIIGDAAYQRYKMTGYVEVQSSLTPGRIYRVDTMSDPRAVDGRRIHSVWLDGVGRFVIYTVVDGSFDVGAWQLPVDDQIATIVLALHTPETERVCAFIKCGTFVDGHCIQD